MHLKLIFEKIIFTVGVTPIYEPFPNGNCLMVYPTRDSIIVQVTLDRDWVLVLHPLMFQAINICNELTWQLLKIVITPPTKPKNISAFTTTTLYRLLQMAHSHRYYFPSQECKKSRKSQRRLGSWVCVGDVQKNWWTKTHDEDNCSDILSLNLSLNLYWSYI